MIVYVIDIILISSVLILDRLYYSIISDLLESDELLSMIYLEEMIILTSTEHSVSYIKKLLYYFDVLALTYIYTIYNRFQLYSIFIRIYKALRLVKPTISI